MPFDIEAQAIVNTVVLQRNAALDQIAVMSGRIAVLEADLKAALDKETAAMMDNGAATNELSERGLKAMGGLKTDKRPA